jgi:hypothetical protein
LVRATPIGPSPPEEPVARPVDLQSAVARDTAALRSSDPTTQQLDRIATRSHADLSGSDAFTGIGSAAPPVILGPEALALFDCLTPAAHNARVDLIREAASD